jgi:hypothetical protein
MAIKGFGLHRKKLNRLQKLKKARKIMEDYYGKLYMAVEG